MKTLSAKAYLFGSGALLLAFAAPDIKTGCAILGVALVAASLLMYLEGK